MNIRLNYSKTFSQEIKPYSGVPWSFIKHLQEMEFMNSELESSVTNADIRAKLQEIHRATFLNLAIHSRHTGFHQGVAQAVKCRLQLQTQIQPSPIVT